VAGSRGIFLFDAAAQLEGLPLASVGSCYSGVPDAQIGSMFGGVTPTSFTAIKLCPKPDTIPSSGRQIFNDGESCSATYSSDDRTGEHSMRTAIGTLSLLSVLSVTNTAIGQEPAPPAIPAQVRSIIILDDDLPEVDRLYVAHSVEGRSGGLKELQERVRQSLRDIGFEHAQVETPTLTTTSDGPSGPAVDVSVKVFTGAQYRLEAVRFRGESVFPADQLRGLFPIETGNLFSAAAIGKGLEQVRKLYGTKGYVDCVVVPQTVVDTSRRTIVLILDVDEGKPSEFGRLMLMGLEPSTGTSDAMLTAWSALEGKPYNPEFLAQWLAVNAPFLPKGEMALEEYVIPQHNPASYTVDVQLRFP